MVDRADRAALEDIENWFSYHPPKGSQVERYQMLREAFKEVATLIVATVPSCADRLAALRHLRATAMMANQAIACNENHEEAESS